MTEYFSTDEINSIIEANKKIVTDRRETFGFNSERLQKVFDFVNSIREPFLKDKRKRIILKASHLLGGITFLQPFNNGNKTTATAATTEFLRRNGYDLIFETEKEEDEHIALLEKTLYKFEDDPTIISEVEDYLCKKVKPKV